MRCTQCRLHETCKNVLQMGNGNKKARIMIVQESPYESENRKGQYMAGKAGRLLSAALEEVGINLDDIYYTSAVKCSAPEDRLPLSDEVKACSDYLWAEIDVVNPEIIVPTGNISLKLLAGVTGITKNRGKIIEKDGLKIFPIIHPNLVLKQPKYMDMFSQDVINLGAIMDGDKAPSSIPSYPQKRLYCETVDSAIAEITRLSNLPPKSIVVIDLETVKANPFIDKVSMGTRAKATYPESERTKICAIGFSDSLGYGSAIPLYHRQSPLKGGELGVVIKLLRTLFARTDLEFGAQNGKFDIRWLRESLDMWYEETLKWDSMLMHYLAVTEEKGTHDLGTLSWLETDMGGYDDELNKVKPRGEDEGNYDLIDWDILKVYLAGDCDVTYRIINKYKKLIDEDETLTWLWDNLMKPGYYTLLDLENNGLSVDMEWLEFLTQEYPGEIKRIEDKLHGYPEVLAMEREWKAMWDERISLGQIKKANRTDEQHEKFEKYKKYDPSKGGCEFNFGSPNQLGELLFNRLGLKTVVLTDKGSFSTNDDSLKYMQRQHPICDTLVEFKKVRNLYNTFIDGLHHMIDKNNIVHPSYNIHGTVTGRLSSTEPNAQQLPRKCNDIMLFQYWHEIKKMFTSRFGDDGVIIQFDYSQLELRILAIFSQDKNLINLYKSGADLHKAVASSAFGVPIEEVTKDQRTAAKKIAFGIVYQESSHGLSDDLRAEGIEMSVEECEAFITAYFKQYPGVSRWISEVKRFATRNKYVVSKTGRIRHLPAIDSTDRYIASEAMRQAVNAPIQSSGSDCTLMALITIDKWLRDTGKRSVVCATVHDSIVFDCPKDEVVEVSHKVKHIMENLAQYNDFYSFIGEVPIVSEMEMGYNYGEIYECTPDLIEEQGVDEFLKAQQAKKRESEIQQFKQADANNINIPVYAYRYWDEYSKL